MRFRSTTAPDGGPRAPFVLSPFLLGGRIAGRRCVHTPAPGTDPAVQAPGATATGAVPQHRAAPARPRRTGPRGARHAGDGSPARTTPLRNCRPAHPRGCRETASTPKGAVMRSHPPIADHGLPRGPPPTREAWSAMPSEIRRRRLVPPPC
ncbi:hypothetical protein LT493_10245 [Streptomyces tricolor]|nr:hypothetical protein [Streptomyces tricolor]